MLASPCVGSSLLMVSFLLSIPPRFSRHPSFTSSPIRFLIQFACFSLIMKPFRGTKDSSVQTCFTILVLLLLLFIHCKFFPCSRTYKRMRGPGFEPGLTARKAVVLPLDYPRFKRLARSLCIYCFWRVKNFEKLFCWCRFCTSHEGGLGCKPR